MHQKLKERQVIEIYQSVKATKDIASDYKVSASTVVSIKNKSAYRAFTDNIETSPGQPVKSTRKILTPKVVEEIYYFSGSADEIKEQFGCSVRVARNIKFGKTYQAVTETLGEAGEIKLYGLTWDDVCSIRSSNDTVTELSDEYNVTAETIRNIRSSKTRNFT